LAWWKKDSGHRSCVLCDNRPKCQESRTVHPAFAEWPRQIHVREDALGAEHEGTRQEIAIKYALADKTLTMSGYQRRNVSGGGEYPEFNL